MIYSLQGGLTPHAKFTVVDGMKRVPFDFNDPPFPVFGENTATRRTLPAGRGIPGGFPGHHIVGSMNQREECFVGFIGASGSDGETSGASNFEKGSPIHLQQLLPEQQNTKTKNGEMQKRFGHEKASMIKT
jgi:hypothetical protein